MKTKTSFTQKISNDVSIEMILVEGNEFIVGRVDDKEKKTKEGKDKVNLSAYFIGKFTITQRVWEEVMGSNPSFHKGKNKPVESVSWYDVKRFIERLTMLSGKVFRLPTETEWEFAARGGIYSEGYLYAGSDKLKEVGWYEANSDETMEVGLKIANELDLYDMSGNVYEWVEDQYHDNLEACPKNGSAWVDLEPEAHRVLRGGCYFSGARACGLYDRIAGSPVNHRNTIGFRLALDPEIVG